MFLPNILSIGAAALIMFSSLIQAQDKKKCVATVDVKWAIAHQPFLARAATYSVKYFWYASEYLKSLLDRREAPPSNLLRDTPLEVSTRVFCLGNRAIALNDEIGKIQDVIGDDLPNDPELISKLGLTELDQRQNFAIDRFIYEKNAEIAIFFPQHLEHVPATEVKVSSPSIDIPQLFNESSMFEIKIGDPVSDCSENEGTLKQIFTGPIHAILWAKFLISWKNSLQLMNSADVCVPIPSNLQQPVTVFNDNGSFEGKVLMYKGLKEIVVQKADGTNVTAMRSQLKPKD